MIKASNLHKRIMHADSEVVILKGIELEIKCGQSVAIIGASGSGKSTLLALLAGLDVSTEGDVTVEGTALGQLNEDGRADFRARKVGFVFQSFQLIPSLTAIENVMLPLEMIGSSNARELARNFLDRVALGHRLSHYPKQLSGGEQQRIALARAFVSEPEILFADDKLRLNKH